MSLLEKLARVNRTAVFLITLALFIGALLIGGPVGGLLILAIGGLLATLMARTWPASPPGARLLRVAVLVLLVITALTMIFR